MIPAPVAAAEGRGRNPFNTAEEIVNETVNNLEVQPTETPEKTQEDYAGKTIDNKSFTQSKTDIKTSDNISKKSIDNKTVSLSMPKNDAIFGLLGAENTVSNDEDLLNAFTILNSQPNGGTIVVTGNCNTSHEDEVGEYVQEIYASPKITLQINAEVEVSGKFVVPTKSFFTITGSGTLSADVEVHSDATLIIKSGIINGKIQNDGGGTISITGGTFSQDVSKFCAEGYVLQMTEAGKYQVVPIEAQILGADGTVIKKGLLSTMLNKASAGQTVQLLRNCDYSNTEIYITKSIAFDLNGFNLISKCYTVTNANTIDTATLTAERSPGLLLSADGYSFKEENTYLPMFDILEGANGYRFFAYTIARYEPKEQKEVVQKSAISGEIQTLKYKYAIRFVNPIGYKILAQGDSRVNLCIGVTWDGSEKRFDLTTASVDALKKYGQSCWNAAQNQQTKYYSMFVRFWNYQNTLVGKETSYCLYVNAMNGTLPITKTDLCSFEVKGEQQ